MQEFLLEYALVTLWDTVCLTVKLHYQAAGSSDVENVDADSNGVKKALINGQLLIIRNGEKFNVMGAQVK